MERCQEFIGVRCIEYADALGDGQHIYNMHLTDTEIIRCRDCGNTYHWNDGEISCLHFEQDVEGVTSAPSVDPNGFCAWAERA